jgi:uncharacterized membrane protein YdbT with pleckstrin-like domain
MTREELAIRIEAFKRDLPQLNALVVAATMMGVLIVVASVYFKRRGSEFPHPILMVVIVIAVLSLIVWWWFRKLTLLRQKHGLVCQSCGKFIAKNGWKTVLQTGRCERCGVAL